MHVPDILHKFVYHTFRKIGDIFIVPFTRMAVYVHCDVNKLVKASCASRVVAHNRLYPACAYSLLLCNGVHNDWMSYSLANHSIF